MKERVRIAKRKYLSSLRSTWVALSLLLFMVVALVVGLRIFHSANQNQSAPTFHFHPDAVTSLKWALGGDTQSFSRASRKQDWTPFVEPERVQDKLDFLATVALEPLAVPASPVIEITVGFAPQNAWRGVYAHGLFVWTEGQWQGRGVRVDPTHTRLFEGGRFEFAKPQWSWCERRPKILQVRAGQEAFTLEQKNLDWWLTLGNQKSRHLDPTRVEKWLGAHCAVKVDAFRDLHAFPLPWALSLNSIHIVYEDDSVQEIPLREDWLLISAEEAITSRDLVRALDELRRFPTEAR